MRIVPGGPFDSEVAADPEIREKLLRQYGLDRPPLAALGRHARAGPARRPRALAQDARLLGERDPRARAAPDRRSSGSSRSLLAILAGVPAGVLAAARRGRGRPRRSWPSPRSASRSRTSSSRRCSSIPFSFELGWFPPAGSGSLRHLVLPAVALAAPIAAAIARLVRSGMIDQLARDSRPHRAREGPRPRARALRPRAAARAPARSSRTSRRPRRRCSPARS